MSTRPTRLHRRLRPTSRRHARPLVEPLEARSLLATFVVNTTADLVAPIPGSLSLRQAIEASNATQTVSNPLATPNTITFNLPAGGIQTIAVIGSPLPPITAPLAIDGYSQGGASANPTIRTAVDMANLLVQIDGSTLNVPGQAFNGLDIQTANCTISGLIITGFSGAGISVSGADAQGNWLLGNFLGALPSPETGNTFPYVSPSGVSLKNGVGVFLNWSNNKVGGDVPGARNVIAGNGVGVSLQDELAQTPPPTGTGNLIQGNFILDNAAQGVLVQSSNNTIGEAAAGGGNVISGNGAEGVLISSTYGLPANQPDLPDVQGNNLLGNFIGTSPGSTDGTMPLGVGPWPNVGDGVRIENSPKNIIGGVSTVARNVIGPNGGDGIAIHTETETIPYAASMSNRVYGNWIGIDIAPEGILFLPNQNGVWTDSSENLIGDSLTGAGNTISNNRGDGVLLSGTGATGNTIQGNIIGLDSTGTKDWGNAFDGIQLLNAPDNVIGGTTTAARNVISGNNNGIEILYPNGPQGSGSLIEGNFIGTAIDGVTDLGNAVDGILVEAPWNTIGGPATGAGNVISGNDDGVRILGTDAHNNTVQGNFIGTDLTGTVALNNEVDGVRIAANASSNLIGGTASGDGNTIAFNAGIGINVESGDFNTIQANSIFDNNADAVPNQRAGGIYLGPGANQNIQPPSIIAATPETSSTGVQGSFVATPLTTYSIEFFASPQADPTGNGQGETYLSRLSVTTDATGHGAFASILPVAMTAGQFVTATITDPVGDTSAFSNAMLAAFVQIQMAAATYTVGPTDTSVTVSVVLVGSLGGSFAVNYSTPGGTARPGVDYTATHGTLVFNTAAPTTVSFTIPIFHVPKYGGQAIFSFTLANPTNGATLGTPASAAVIIGNSNLSVFVVNTSDDVVDPSGVELSLRQAILESNATQSTSDPLATPNQILFNIPGSGVQTISLTSPLPAITAPVEIQGYTQPGSSGNPITGTAADTAALMVQVDGSTLAPGATPVDGLDIQTANCIVSGLIVTGFSGAGIAVTGVNSQGNWLWGNFLGALPAPTVGNSFPSGGSLANGVGLLLSWSNNRVGGNTPGLRNVIAGNGVGVSLQNDPGAASHPSTGTGNLIQGNFILDNSGVGVLVQSSNNTIGEAISGGGNVISGNAAQGVLISSVPGLPDVQGNTLLSNDIGTGPGSIDGTTPLGVTTWDYVSNTPWANAQEGVRIENSPKNVIGGLTTTACNVVGPNGLDGVLITGATAVANRVLGNDIGMDIMNGLEALLPNRNGITVDSSGNFIGAAVSGAGNTIDSNRGYGVWLNGPGASGNTIQGNLIGLNPAGGSAFGNSFDGVHLDDAPNNLIGGTTTAARNVISGNNNGVVINGTQATGNLVEGNFIGTASDGLTDLGNAVDGVLITGASLNVIGGTATGAGNVISGNNYGTQISGTGALNNDVQGNFIGTDLTGTAVIGNKVDGILIDAGANSNLIGGSATGAGNVIAFNAGAGVNVDDGVFNTISANSIHDNNALGIVLNPTTSANNNLPAPMLLAAAPAAGATGVQGTLVATPLTTYSIEFFASAAKDPSGFGQGQTYLFRYNVTTSKVGHASFALNIPVVVASGQFVTSTTTDVGGDTSAFSNAIPAVPVQVQMAAATYTVNENAGTVLVTVTRAGGTGGAVAVNYATGGGTATPGVDYKAVQNTLYFNPGVTSQSFNIPILDPKKVGGQVTFKLTLSNPTSGATLGTPPSSTITILDNDAASLGLAASSYTVREDAGQVALTVTRNTTVGVASVAYATASGTAVAGVNFTSTHGTLTFAAGVASQTISVPVLLDNKITPSLVFTVNLSNPSGAVLDPRAASSSVTITETETPGALGLSASAVATAPGASAAAVTVVRLGGAVGTVSIAYATAGGTAAPGYDYTPVSGFLMFAPGVTSQVISVPLLHNATPGADVTFQLTLSRPGGGATLGAITTSTITVLHPISNDHVPPTITAFVPIVTGSAITGLSVTFSEPMDLSRASSLQNYAFFVTTPGPDGVLGTYDDGSVAITGVTYTPASLTAVLTLKSPLALGTFYQVTLDRDAGLVPGHGLTDLAGNLLDGTGTGKFPGTPYVSTFAEARRLSYTDHAGDAVTLSLAGPGMLVLQRTASGDAQALRIVGGTSGSVLTGSVLGPLQGRKRAAASTVLIPVINGAGAAKIRLGRPFVVGSITAAAVDKLAVMSQLPKVKAQA